MDDFNATTSICADAARQGWVPANARLVYSLALSRETLSNNVLRAMHFHAYRTARQQWHMLTRAALGRQPREAALEHAFLVVHRYCAGAGLDWDNAYGGLKPLLDCLVLPNERNPDGLGLIKDDSPGHMPWPPLVRQHGAKPGQGRTELLIYDISPACP